MIAIPAKVPHAAVPVLHTTVQAALAAHPLRQAADRAVHRAVHVVVEAVHTAVEVAHTAAETAHIVAVVHAAVRTAVEVHTVEAVLQ